MNNFVTLQRFLAEQGSTTGGEAILCIAEATARISGLIGQGELVAEVAAAARQNVASQQTQQRYAARLIGEALSESPVVVLGLEEAQNPVRGRGPASLRLTIDPLDGAANIATNAPMGTIFSLLPPVDSDELPCGRQLIAAGFAIYGVYTALVLALGDGVHIFTLDRKTSDFMLTHPNVRVPLAVQEYAINASNYRYWEEPVRAYVDDCVADEDRDRLHFNMRWIGSLVAEAFRILIRGGIFLYPRDRRPGFHAGRMRLVHAASPVAYIIEQAGGLATDGRRRILDIQATALNEPVPFIFGSRDHVECVMRYHTDSRFETDHAPLFRHRGLFQA